MKFKALLGLMIVASIGLMSFTQKSSNTPVNKWERLGQKVVNMKADHDEILVGAKDGVFTAVKFKVMKAPIFIHNIKIVYGNGETQNFVLNRRFPMGTESKIIDLPGNKRIIRKIKLNYKSAPSARGRAVVVAWGRR